MSLKLGTTFPTTFIDFLALASSDGVDLIVVSLWHCCVVGYSTFSWSYEKEI
jgi:hypothetical protein